MQELRRMKFIETMERITRQKFCDNFGSGQSLSGLHSADGLPVFNEWPKAKKNIKEFKKALSQADFPDNPVMPFSMLRAMMIDS